MNEIEKLLVDVRSDISDCELKLARLRGAEEWIVGKLRPGKTAKTKSSIAAEANGTPKDIVKGPLSQADAGEKALIELGREAKISEILDLAFARGWLIKSQDTVKVKNLSNSLYGALKRNADRFVLSKPGTFDLKSRGKVHS